MWITGSAFLPDAEPCGQLFHGEGHPGARFFAKYGGQIRPWKVREGQIRPYSLPEFGQNRPKSADFHSRRAKWLFGKPFGPYNENDNENENEDENENGNGNENDPVPGNGNENENENEPTGRPLWLRGPVGALRAGAARALARRFPLEKGEGIFSFFAGRVRQGKPLR